MSRLIIARGLFSDRDELLRAHRESRALHHPWAAPFTDEAGFEAWMARSLTGPNIGFVAREATTGGIAAVVNLNEIVFGAFRSAYLGYWGMRASAGRGLVTEAVGLVVAEAFQGLGLHRVEANIQPGNTRSLALVRRLGFRREGVSPRYLRIDGEWRDHERWAKLSDDAPGDVPR
ncbi:GNAT family N-acetyltransferase [Roseomonas gilardii]|uniref:GNAT family N-acetyltransferase n=1 Tax=Roseomonas gilardii TaxID=257708 RepID=UPI0011A32733|nr:GNAT family protein [Roseomonas gilardii]